MVDWPAIVEQHGPVVWRTAYRLLSERGAADEVYQETFLQAVRFSRGNQVTNWPGLLKRIATTRALDQLRVRYRRPTEHLENGELVVGREPSPERSMESEEALEEFRQLLAELPKRQAEVFWLREVEEMNHDQIAAQFEVTANQVATWLHRAKRKLRQLLSDRDEMTEEVAS